MIQTLFGSVKQEPGLLERLKEGVKKTRQLLGSQLDNLLRGKERIDEATLEELEYLLISADVGVSTTEEILNSVREEARKGKATSAEDVKRIIKKHLLDIFRNADRPPAVPSEPPLVILVVGVNGTGKTTTIGKLASRLKEQGNSVLLCAGDTFRAAAIEQLEIWGKRAGCPVIRQQPGADPSAVLFDAIQAAKARNVDVVIADTAGRLHTKTNLMAELQKMQRTAAKLVPGAPHEILLVIDATTGQNGLEQARKFKEHIGVTGLVLTKLDGTAKGGIAVAIARELGLPIRFVGVGEKIEDLLPFDSERFVESLFEA